MSKLCHIKIDVPILIHSKPIHTRSHRRQCYNWSLSSERHQFWAHFRSCHQQRFPSNEFHSWIPKHVKIKFTVSAKAVLNMYAYSLRKRAESLSATWIPVPALALSHLMIWPAWPYCYWAGTPPWLPWNGIYYDGWRIWVSFTKSFSYW